MRRIMRVCFGVCISWLASCSSSDSTGGSDSGGGSTGAGGTMQDDCTTQECFVAFECVHECGGPVVRSGCCGCGPTLIDIHQCAADATSEKAPGDASVGSGGGKGDARACEQFNCLRANECVRACGGTVEYAGCCACDAPLFDRITCDGGL
jgi:hypothetical protein